MFNPNTNRSKRGVEAYRMQLAGADIIAIAAHFGVSKNEARNLVGRGRCLLQTPAERDAAAVNAFSFFGAVGKREVCSA